MSEGEKKQQNLDFSADMGSLPSSDDEASSPPDKARQATEHEEHDLDPLSDDDDDDPFDPPMDGRANFFNQNNNGGLKKHESKDNLVSKMASFKEETKTHSNDISSKMTRK
jgi:hypothetical protein|tara:strand:+ start:66 stop:398 length:333 start_codon:yes stop_codon:yes gene_type:complete